MTRDRPSRVAEGAYLDSVLSLHLSDAGKNTNVATIASLKTSAKQPAEGRAESAVTTLAAPAASLILAR